MGTVARVEWQQPRGIRLYVQALWNGRHSMKPNRNDPPVAIQNLSIWIDEYNEHKTKYEQLWERVGKVAEEAGEIFGALIGYGNQNPRKGKTHSLDDIKYELLDVAVTALGAYEHITGNQGLAMEALDAHISHITARAGL